MKGVFGGSIGLDPCSNEYSIVGAKVEYALPVNDGLVEPWLAETIYVNPPYGSDRDRGTRILNWFVKMVEAYRNGSEVIALVPVATNTRHWKEYVYPVADAVCFIAEPRLRFYIGGQEDRKGAPMSCAAIYYGPRWESFAREFRAHGPVVPLKDVVLPVEGAQLSIAL